jgi:hypothetical protein
MSVVLAVALLLAGVAVSSGNLIDPPRTFNPVTEDGMSVGYTLNSDNNVNGIVMYYSGAVHIGDFYKSSDTATSTAVAVGHKCDQSGVLYEYFSGTDTLTTLDNKLDDDPPSLAKALKGPSTTQYIGCKVPGMTNDVGYHGLGKDVSWKNFIQGPQVYEDSSCTGNVAAQIFVRNGTSITVNVMGRSFTVAYPFTHLNTGIACTQFSTDSRLYWKNPTNTSTYNLERHMQAFGTMPVPGKTHTKWNWLAIFYVTITASICLGFIAIATFAPVKRSVKVSMD